jgi:hypothetical protein
MSRQPRTPSEIDRQQFVGAADVLAALGVTVEELADPDVRMMVRRHEHPEFEDALTQGLEEIDLGDGPMNPRLHLAMHGIVATQLWDDSPPEVWEAAVRLLNEGYGRHEILHMLGRSVSDQVWTALHDERPYDRERHVVALRARPGSWEQERATRTSAQRHNDARKQTRRNTRVSRMLSRTTRSTVFGASDRVATKRAAMRSGTVTPIRTKSVSSPDAGSGRAGDQVVEDVAVEV